MKNIKLYQFKNSIGLLKYSFLSENKLTKKEFDEDFEIVAEDKFNEDIDDLVISEMIFEKYNRDDRPNGRTHRSMCVGDVVDIDNIKYQCKSFGFEKLNF